MTALARALTLLQGVLRVRTVDFGGSWAPLFDSADHQQGGVTHWPVAVTHAELYCIVSAENAMPTVLPRPILTRQDTGFQNHATYGYAQVLKHPL